jgi:ELWxxDGT repeat protein
VDAGFATAVHYGAGIAAPAHLLKDVNPGPGSGSAIASCGPGFLEIEGTTFFVADDGVHGSELWKTDGTCAGTVLVKDIQPGAGSSSPLCLANLTGTLLFSANDGVQGRELWRSDGTEAGTMLVMDLVAGSGSSSPLSGSHSVFEGKMFFVANTPFGGRWKTDGAQGGTSAVWPGGTGPLGNFGGWLFFIGRWDSSVASELLKTDGTAAGTVLVQDLYPGTTQVCDRELGCMTVVRSAVPSEGVTVAGSALVFVAREVHDPTNWWNLWVTDGATARTLDSAHGTFVDGQPVPAFYGLTAVGNSVFYLRPGLGLWKRSLPDFDSAEWVSTADVSAFTNANGTLYMSADGIEDRELWKTDGTPEGTVLVKDINMGGSSDPMNLTAVDGAVYFTADDGIHGRELWKSAGTPEGTVLVQNIAPSSASSNPADLIYTTAGLFFSASDGTNGREPWLLPASAPAMSITDAAMAEGSSGTTSFVFTVSLSNPSSQTVTVNYATAAETASAGSDYGAASGMVVFPPGSTSEAITVLVKGDTAFESDETFFVDLTMPCNAALDDRQGVGTIVNDDFQPTISINDLTVVEGNSGTLPATFTASLSNASYETVTVTYTTADGMATAGSDYAFTTGTATFLPGNTSQPITVLVNGDTSSENAEDFFVNLTAPANATIGESQGRATILDDEGITLAGMLVPDGRAVSRTMDVKGDTYRGTVVAGRTYTVEVEAPFDGEGTVAGGPQPVLAVTRADGVTPLATTPAIRSSCAPSNLASSGAVTRLSFTPSAADVAGGPVTLYVTDVSSSGYVFRVRLQETTMYCPRWSVNGYRALITLQNTTACAIGGDIQLVDSAGTTVMTLPFSLGGGEATQLEVLAPPVLAGSARLTHDGPAGAIVGGIYMVPSGGGTGGFRWPFVEMRASGSTDGK